MLNFTLAAEYRSIVFIKRICLFYRIYDGPTITVFDGRNIFPRSFTPLYVLVEIRPALPSLFNIDLIPIRPTIVYRFAAPDNLWIFRFFETALKSNVMGNVHVRRTGE